MAGAVFLAAIGCCELVVFGLDVAISHRIFLLEIRKQRTNQHDLASLLHLGFVFIAAIQPGFLGFLHEDFAVDDFFFDLVLHLGRDRAARLLRGNLADQGVNTVTGNGLAVDDR